MVRFILIIIAVFIYFIFMIPLGLAMVITGLFSQKAKDKFAKAVLDFGFKAVTFMSGVKVRYIGLDKLIKDKPVLYVANHSSFFDVILVNPVLPSATAYIAKKSFAKVPVFAQVMKLSHSLFLDRDDIKQGLKIILEAIELVKSGISVFVFPEGTRSKTGEIADFKEGSMKVSTKSGCPIIPISISNTAAVWEDHFPKIEPREVVIEILDPVYPGDFDRDAQKHLGKYCRNLIEETNLKNMQSLA